MLRWCKFKDLWVQRATERMRERGTRQQSTYHTATKLRGPQSVCSSPYFGTLGPCAPTPRLHVERMRERGTRQQSTYHTATKLLGPQSVCSSPYFWYPRPLCFLPRKAPQFPQHTFTRQLGDPTLCDVPPYVLVTSALLLPTHLKGDPPPARTTTNQQ